MGIKIVPTRDLPWGMKTLKAGVEVEMQDPKAAQALVDGGDAKFAQQKKTELPTESKE